MGFFYVPGQPTSSPGLILGGDSMTFIFGLAIGFLHLALASGVMFAFGGIPFLWKAVNEEITRLIAFWLSPRIAGKKLTFWTAVIAGLTIGIVESIDYIVAFSTSWEESLYRLFPISIHVSASVLIFWALSLRRIRFFIAALVIHFVYNYGLTYFNI